MKKPEIWLVKGKRFSNFINFKDGDARKLTLKEVGLIRELIYVVFENDEGERYRLANSILEKTMFKVEKNAK